MKKKILVAPLNWGLGHATRCIPLINALIAEDFVPVIASDGAALTLLRKEFPDLSTLELPSYNITYTKNGKLFKLKLLKDLPKLLKAIKAEKKAIASILEHNTISGIISDNRFGIRNKNRTLGTQLSGAFLFGEDESFQITSNSYASFNLLKTKKSSLKLKPQMQLIWIRLLKSTSTYLLLMKI